MLRFRKEWKEKRLLEIPTIADRVAQMVVRMNFEPMGEPVESMSKIVLIASGDNIAKYGIQLKKELKNSQDLQIINGYMEEAVSILRNQPQDEIDVVIARGNTAKMLREAKLPFPIVNIPVKDFEIVNTIRAAKDKTRKENPLIGYIGLVDIINNISYFLKALNFNVRLYQADSTLDIENSIVQAKMDQVDVLIGGVYTCQLLQNNGMAYVLLESSLASIREAYGHAKEIQKSVYIQKKKLQEKNSILDSVSEGIISINERGLCTSMNRASKIIFGGTKSEETIGHHYFSIFGEKESNLIQKSFSTKEKTSGKMVELYKKRYFMTINPVIANKKSFGVILFLQEINEIQKMQNNVHRNLYLTDYNAHYSFQDVIGNSFEIRRTVTIAQNYAATNDNILMIGEMGVGKDFFAQCIHNEGEHRDGPFISVDCCSLNYHVEKELVGIHSENYLQQQAGLFEMARGGTLYLSNISALSMDGQACLMGILNQVQVQAIDTRELNQLDVRLITGSSENLLSLMRQGKFRKDLYYRLCILPLPIPALRHRKGDTTAFIQYFIEKYCVQFKKRIELSADSLKKIEKMNWEGNIEQIDNFCKQMVIFSQSDMINTEWIENHLEGDVYFSHLESSEMAAPLLLQKNDLTGAVVKRRRITEQELNELERFYGGNRSLMAAKLGISRTTLWKYMNKRTGK